MSEKQELTWDFVYDKLGMRKAPSDGHFLSNRDIIHPLILVNIVTIGHFLAENPKSNIMEVHDNLCEKLRTDGWTFGIFNEENKTTPLLMPFRYLPENFMSGYLYLSAMFDVLYVKKKK